MERWCSGGDVISTVNSFHTGSFTAVEKPLSIRRRKKFGMKDFRVAPTQFDAANGG